MNEGCPQCDAAREPLWDWVRNPVPGESFHYYNPKTRIGCVGRISAEEERARRKAIYVAALEAHKRGEHG